MPEATIAALRGIDRDLSRAVVRVVQPLEQDPPRSPAELAEFGGQAVIVVAPSRTITERTGAELVPLSDGRALLAFNDTITVSQFELRLLDALADPSLDDSDRETFTALTNILGGTRRSGRAQMGQRNIIVFQGLDEGADRRSVRRAPVTPSKRRSDRSARRIADRPRGPAAAPRRRS